MPGGESSAVVSAFAAFLASMSTAWSTMKSEFATAEEAAVYDRWFRAKVQASLDDPRPAAPHDEVMAKMRDFIEAKRLGNTAGSEAH